MPAKDDFLLTGKVALVTGAARGIGAECAMVLAAAGASVVVSDILRKEGKETVEAIKKTGGKAAFIEQDATKEDQWVSTIDTTIDTFGGIDILVNNAGIEIMGAVDGTSLEDFRKVMAINCEGVFLGCKHAVAAMRPGGRDGRGGSIVNISSIAGLIGLPFLTAYGASKGAVKLMTKDIAVECGRLGLNVRCNSVHPGVVETVLAESFIQKNCALWGINSRDQMVQMFIDKHPLGRLGKPRDIANAVRFLASDASSWMTGAEIVVDGGWTAA